MAYLVRVDKGTHLIVVSLGQCLRAEWRPFVFF
jgi:hypothetical protein